jgi:DNA repair protein RadC
MPLEDAGGWPPVPKPAEAQPRPEKPAHAGHRERLRERFLNAPGAVPDYEILELLLFAANPRGDTKPLAKALIARFRTLSAVLAADAAALARVEGSGPAAIAVIKAAREAGLRMLRAEAKAKPVVASWQALLDYLQASMAENATEQFRILFLDNKNRIIEDEEQQRGTVNHTPVYPREVVKRALELHASALILVHNHPSGDPKPSRADIDMTRAVRDAAKSVDIALHDHIVIGRGQHASFRALGLL